MADRLSLHSVLQEVLGSNNVYFQPPETLKLKYPCILYELNNQNERYANDLKYLARRNYSVTIIDRNPDCIFLEKMDKLPLCSFDRTYVSNNLNHFVYRIYY